MVRTGQSRRHTSLAVASALLVGASLAWVAAPARAGDFSARDVYRDASPSVVVVFAVLGSAVGTGTGSVVTSDGLVLTNNHVISESENGPAATEIGVIFKPARITGDMERDMSEVHRATVIARSAELDLAVLKVEGKPSRRAAAIPFGDSDEIEIGEQVAAIGHPGGGGLWTLTTGTISSSRREGARDVFQTDTAINPGNSGGPLLDADARLIGVNTYTVRVSPSGVPLEGLNYSIRGNLVREWLSRHGVRVAMADRTPAPTVVAAADPPSPAPEPTPAEPTPEPAPAEPTPEPGPAEPTPEPEPPVAATPAPTPPRARPPEPTPEPTPPPRRDEPRAFTGPDGEEMYGIPDPDFTPEAAAGVYAETLRNSRDAFDELDGTDLEDF